jgi:hypothetical protein
MWLAEKLLVWVLIFLNPEYNLDGWGTGVWCQGSETEVSSRVENG